MRIMNDIENNALKTSSPLANISSPKTIPPVILSPGRIQQINAEKQLLKDAKNEILKLEKKICWHLFLSKPLLSFVDVIFFAFLAELDQFMHISGLALLTHSK